VISLVAMLSTSAQAWIMSMTSRLVLRTPAVAGGGGEFSVRQPRWRLLLKSCSEEPAFKTKVDDALKQAVTEMVIYSTPEPR